MAWELLTRLKLAGKVVTGDALYAQREFSRYVVGRGGDCFWVIKENQPDLRDAVCRWQGILSVQMGSESVSPSVWRSDETTVRRPGCGGGW